MDDYLKLGSVFLPKGPKAMPLMVVGYLPVNPENDEMYDYLVVMYPQGFISNNSLLMIDHGDVGAVLFNGYFDENTDQMLKELQSI